MFDQQHNVRQATRIALGAVGFKEIDDTHDFAAFEERAGQRDYELLIAEIHGVDGDSCELVYRIRHNEAGRNPFIPIILTAWNPSRELAMQAIDSGADDLLSKPLSTAQISNRITTLGTYP